MAKKRKSKGSRRSLGGTGDYLVGYGRPPMHSRFKPGQSGNPPGRSKKGLHPHDVVEKQLSKIITARIGGVAKRMTVLEALVASFLATALTGKASGITALKNLTNLVDSLTSSTKRRDSQDALDHDWPEIEVSFVPGPSPPRAGDCLDTDEVGNAYENAKGEYWTAISQPAAPFVVGNSARAGRITS